MINERQAKKFCKEDISKIKNYDLAIADTTQTWECHHRTAIWWNCSRQDLIDNECYYGRKACELIFLTKEEHRSLHNLNRSESTKIKMSESHKGKPSPNKGKTFSEESRRKLSESHKGNTTTVFGAAFKEHYGITRCDNVKLYNKEYSFYMRNGKFSWN